MERRKILDFKVGDRVYCEEFGFGVVVRILSPAINTFPVEVEFDQGKPYKDRKFMLSGQYAFGGPDVKKDITKVNQAEKSPS